MSVTYPNHKSEECKILKDEIGFQTRLASGNIKNIKEDRLRFRKVIYNKSICQNLLLNPRSICI